MPVSELDNPATRFHTPANCSDNGIDESRRQIVSDNPATLLRACLAHLQIQTRLLMSREMFGKEFMALDPMDKIEVEQTMQALLSDDQPLSFLTAALPQSSLRKMDRPSVHQTIETLEASVAQVAKVRSAGRRA
jgi:hypothetical protein